MSAKVAVTNKGGLLIWLPAHKATPAEETSPSPAIFVPDPAPTILNAGLCLFEGEICGPFLQTGSCPNAAACRNLHRGANEVLGEIARFRASAQKDPTNFVKSRRYVPGGNPFAAAPVPPPQPAFVPPPLPPMMAGGIPQQQFAMMDSTTIEMSHTNLHAPMPRLPGAAALPAPSIAGAVSAAPMQMMAPPPLPMMPPMPASHGMPPSHGMQPQYHHSAPQEGFDGGYMSRGRGRGRGRGAGGPPGVEVREAEPLEYPLQPLPDKEVKHYANPKTRVYVANLPRSRHTVWLRNFEPRPAHYERIITCKGGTMIFVKAEIADIVAAKAVALFDRPLCNYFCQYGSCSRPMCACTHRSEEQIKTLVACRHKQLKEMSAEERQAALDQMIANDEKAENLWTLTGAGPGAAGAAPAGREDRGDARTPPSSSSRSGSQGSSSSSSSSSSSESGAEGEERKSRKRARLEDAPSNGGDHQGESNGNGEATNGQNDAGNAEAAQSHIADV